MKWCLLYVYYCLNGINSHDVNRSKNVFNVFKVHSSTLFTSFFFLESTLFNLVFD